MIKPENNLEKIKKQILLHLPEYKKNDIKILEISGNLQNYKSGSLTLKAKVGIYFVEIKCALRCDQRIIITV
jgi:hypothetical protein